MGGGAHQSLVGPLPEGYLSLLGKIVVSFSQFDHLLTLLVGGSFLMGWEEVVRLHPKATAHKIWLLEMQWHAKLIGSERERFVALISKSKTLNGERNRLIHDLWTLVPSELGSVLRVRVSQDFDVHELSETSSEITIDGLEKFHQDVLDLIHELNVFLASKVYDGLEAASPTDLQN